MVILITGKKGSGKSTYAKRLKAELEAEDFEVVWLDGDVFRAETQNNDYTMEGRRRNLHQAAEIAAAHEAKGRVVLCSFIAPTKALRKMMRRHWAISRLVYIPGGTLWEGTTYERPSDRELEVYYNQRVM